MQAKINKTLLISLGVSFLLLLLLLPDQVHGQEVLRKQEPVPNYDPVQSIDDKTIATVPDNLKTRWRGSFTVNSQPLITYPEVEIKQLLKSLYSNQILIWQTQQTYRYNPAEVYDWTDTIAKTVNAETAEPELVIENGRATKFTPPQIGRKLDRYNSAIKILEALEQDQDSIELSVLTVSPKTSLAELNDLGIKELVGRGMSNFAGSPANRRHNIRVGTEKIKGVIVKPGEEFSFNKYLGPVEASEGFLPELVIKGNDTIPELGGGLCQVSSTTFRAIMHAGLPITQRKNHSYAVQYYAPQGSDATIYPGVVDLKFVNDTGNSILIWPYFKDSNYLYFDFYGTYDGREVEMGTPVVYDRQSNGAMKATWTRKVTINGETKTDRFASVYRPPAEFHRSEEFVENPESEGKPDTDVEFFVGDNPNQNNTEDNND